MTTNNDTRGIGFHWDLDAIEKQMQQDQSAMAALTAAYAPKLKAVVKVEREEELGYVFTFKGLLKALVKEPIDNFAYQQQVLANEEFYNEYTRQYTQHTNAQKNLSTLYQRTNQIVQTLKEELRLSKTDATVAAKIRIHQKELLDLRWQILAAKCDLFVGVKNYIRDYPSDYTQGQREEFSQSFKSIIDEVKQMARICNDPVLKHDTFIKACAENLESVVDNFKRLCELYHNKMDLEIILDFVESNVVDVVAQLAHESLRRTAETPKEQRIIAIKVNLASEQSKLLAVEEVLIKTFHGASSRRDDKMKLEELLRAQAERIGIADRDWRQLEQSSLHAQTIARSEQLWKDKAWARLILDRNDSLSRTVCDFDRKIQQLEIQIESSISDEAKRQFEKQIKKYEVARHQVLLQRIVEVIGDKQRFLKQNRGDPQARFKAQQDISILNEAFQHFFEKYTLQYISLPQVTLQEYFLDPLKKLNPWSQGIPIHPQKILTDKRYADVGYKMLEDGKAWFDKFTLKPGETLDGKLKVELEGFLRWADDHPRAAAGLASDMAQVCAILQDQDLITQFKKSLQAKINIAAVLGELGREVVEPVEGPEHLHYRALADFCHFLPTSVAAGRATVKALFSKASWLQTAWDIGIDTVTAKVVQNAVNIIPPRDETMILAVTGILQGEPMYVILEEQKKIQLLKLAGDVRRVVVNPESGIPRRIVGNWWKSIWIPKSFTEKALRVLTQLVVPTVAIGTLTTIAAVLTPVSMFSVPIFGILVNPFILFSVSMGALPFAVLYMRFTGSVLNEFYPKTEREIEEAEVKKEMAKHAPQLEQKAQAYIKWIKRNILPNVMDQKDLHLNNAELTRWMDAKPQATIVNRFKEALVAGVAKVCEEDNIDKPHSITCIKTFIQKANYKKIREQVRHLMIEEWVMKKDPDVRKTESWLISEGLPENKRHDAIVEKIKESEYFALPANKAALDKMTALVLHQLVEEWLTPEIQVSYQNEFIDQCLVLKEEISVDDVDPKESLRTEVQRSPGNPTEKELVQIIINDHLDLRALGQDEGYYRLVLPAARTA